MGAAPTTQSLSCSVVVPVRDDATELRGLLRSLERQSVAPLEIIVVDNGSSDDSAKVARRAGCTVIEEPELGIAAAAATGYDRARGDLIVRCDADSRPHRAWIDGHQRAHRLGGARTVIVTGPAHFILPPPFGVIAAAVYLGAYMLATGVALGHLPAFGTTMSMRRTWWESVRTEVSRSAHVHDDMDLSFHVRPGETIRLAWSARAGMSPRALRPGPSWRLRWKRAGYTLRRNWQIEKPWHRWARRVKHARGTHAARISVVARRRGQR